MIDAMKQAMEALDKSVSTCFDRYAYEQVMSRPEHFINQTIAALRLAIEQAERQEPVAWLYRDEWKTLKLSQITPPPTGSFPGYTAPPQRQPLTEEEMLEILVGIDAATKRLPPGMKAFARAIERAHGIGGGE